MEPWEVDAVGALCPDSLSAKRKHDDSGFEFSSGSCSSKVIGSLCARYGENNVMSSFRKRCL